MTKVYLGTERRAAKTSVVLQNIAEMNPQYIDQYYCDSDGHWMHTTSGFIFPSMECGTLHEDTVSDMLAMISEGVAEANYENGFSTPKESAQIFKLKVN